MVASLTIKFSVRKFLRASVMGAIALAAYPVAALAQGSPSELGVWYNHTGKGAVQVYRCTQDASRLCGRIIWLKSKVDSSGNPLVDRLNPKASMKGRSICGLPVLGNLKQSSDGSWKDGWVYDPEKGASYDASIQAKNGSVLTLTGYKGIFYKTFQWKRAPDDLARCGDLEPVQ